MKPLISQIFQIAPSLNYCYLKEKRERREEREREMRKEGSGKEGWKEREERKRTGERQGGKGREEEKEKNRKRDESWKGLRKREKFLSAAKQNQFKVKQKDVVL